MTEIPDDIKKAANECVAQFRWNNDNRWHLFVARAIQEERERDGWQPIETAPKGCVTEDAGCRGASEWFLGRVAQKYRRGRPPFIVIYRRAWPQEDSWECAGEACYVPDFFDAWQPLPPKPAAVSEGGEDE